MVLEQGRGAAVEVEHAIASGWEAKTCALRRRHGASGGHRFSLVIAHLLPSMRLPGMAEVGNKYPENTAGKYYVDDQCIECGFCRETAPSNFTRKGNSGYSYVYKQPETEEEEVQCREAMASCPVEAIGDNGA